MQMNSMSGLINLISATISSGRSFTFWSWLWNIISGLFIWILKAIIGVFYFIIQFVLNIVDLMQYFVKRLIGLDFWGTDKVETGDYLESDIIFRFIKDDTVQRVFKYMIGIFAVLLIVFTIIAIIKSEYQFATSGGDNSKKGTFVNAFKGIFMVIMVPILLTVGIMASNAVLQGIVNAFALNNRITFGGQVFVSSAYDASKYKTYANSNDRYPTSTSITMYYEIYNSETDATIEPPDFELELPDGKTEDDYSGSVEFTKAGEFCWDSGYELVEFDFGILSKYTRLVAEDDNHSKTYQVRNISLERNSVEQKAYTFDTTVPEIKPKDYNEDNKITGFIFKGVANERNTNFFWKVHSVKDGLSAEAQITKEALTYYYITKMGYDIVDSSVSVKVVDKLWPGTDEYITKNFASWRNYELEELHQDEFIMQAVYNSWYYNEYMTQITSFENSLVYHRTGFTSAYGTEYYSAVTYKNSDVWASRYDGGKSGLVALPSEYKVMGDFINFMVGNCMSCSIVDITSSDIDWNSVVNTSQDAKKFYNFRGTNINQFMVEYMDEGYVVYNPVHAVESELEGAIYIMCYRDVMTGKYIPVLANTVQTVRMQTVNGTSSFEDTFRFSSEYLGANYKGFIVARGGFTEKWTTGLREAGLPTYISATPLYVDSIGLEFGVSQSEMSTVNAVFDQVLFDFERVSGGALPYSFTANTYVEQTEETIDHPVYYKWIDDRPLSTLDEFDADDQLTKIGINGSLKPFEEVFKGLTIDGTLVDENCVWEPNEYSYTNEYGNPVFGFSTTYDGDKYSFLLEHDKENTTTPNAFKVIRSDDFKYTYTKGGVKYYLHEDGVFRTNSATAAIFNSYSFINDKVEKNSGSQIVATRFSFEGYTKGSIYYGKLVANKITDRTSSVWEYTGVLDNPIYYGLPDYAHDSVNVLEGYLYSISYYNYFTCKVGGDIKEYVASGVAGSNASEKGEMSLDVNRLDFKQGMIFASAIKLTRTTDGFEKPNVITIDIGEDKFKLYMNILGAELGISDDSAAIAEILTNQHYYQFQDTNFSVYNQLVEYVNDDAAKMDYSDYVMNIQFINTRANEGMWKLDFYLNLLNIFNDEASIRFKLGIGTHASQTYIIEEFKRGEFYLDYNFSDGGPEMETLYVKSRINVIILVFATFLILKLLGTAVWGLIARIYEIVLYFIVMPGIASFYPLDGGKKFEAWRKALFEKVLGTYGVMIGLNAFFLLLPPIQEASQLFNAEDLSRMTSGIGKMLSGSVGALNSIVYILFLLVAFTMIQTAPKMISSLVGGEDMVDKGSKVQKNVRDNTDEVKRQVSGKAAKDSFKKMVGDLKSARDFIPGSAIWGSPEAKKLAGKVVGATGRGLAKAGSWAKSKGQEFGSWASAQGQRFGSWASDTANRAGEAYQNWRNRRNSGDDADEEENLPDLANENQEVRDSDAPITDEEFAQAQQDAQDFIDDGKLYEQARKELQEAGMSNMEITDEDLEAKIEEIKKRGQTPSTPEPANENNEVRDSDAPITDEEFEQGQRDAEQFIKDGDLYGQARKELQDEGMSNNEITDEDLEAKVEEIKKRNQPEPADKNNEVRDSDAPITDEEFEQGQRDAEQFIKDGELYGQARKELQDEGMTDIEITDEDLEARVEEIKKRKQNPPPPPEPQSDGRHFEYKKSNGIKKGSRMVGFDITNDQFERMSKDYAKLKKKGYGDAKIAGDLNKKYAPEITYGSGKNKGHVTSDAAYREIIKAIKDNKKNQKPTTSNVVNDQNIPPVDEAPDTPKPEGPKPPSKPSGKPETDQKNKPEEARKTSESPEKQDLKKKGIADTRVEDGEWQEKTKKYLLANGVKEDEITESMLYSTFERNEQIALERDRYEKYLKENKKKDTLDSRDEFIDEVIFKELAAENKKAYDDIAERHKEEYEIYAKNQKDRRPDQVDLIKADFMDKFQNTDEYHVSRFVKYLRTSRWDMQNRGDKRYENGINNFAKRNKAEYEKYLKENSYSDSRMAKVQFALEKHGQGVLYEGKARRRNDFDKIFPPTLKERMVSGLQKVHDAMSSSEVDAQVKAETRKTSMIAEQKRKLAEKEKADKEAAKKRREDSKRRREAKAKKDEENN